MFQSYDYSNIRYIYTLSTINKIQIIDSDFSVNKDVNYKIPALTEIFEFIIDTYEEKKLNVAANNTILQKRKCKNEKSYI